MSNNQGGYTIKEMIELMWDDIKEIKTDVKTQNGRIDRLEIKWARLVGIGSVLVITIPIVVRLLW